MMTKKNILWTFLAFVAIAMLTGIAAVILPSGWVREEVLVTIFIIGAYSLAGIVLVGIAPKHNKHTWTLRICVVSLAISMLIYIALVWVDSYISWRTERYFWKPASIALILGFATAHRLMVAPLNVPLLSFRVIKRSALISAAIITFIIIYATLFEDFWFPEELMIRLLAIGAIIAAGSTIAAGAIVIFAPKPGDDEQGTLVASIEIPLNCPRCRSAMTALSNKESRCPGCRLKVRVEIEEPRCTCGYLLYQLQSSICPECGKPVPKSEQWEGGSDQLTEPTVERWASDDQDQTPSSSA